MVARQLIKRGLRQIGRDITRWPHPESLGYHLNLVFARHGVNLVLDVGANGGQYGQLLRDIGYQGVIVSFEPAAAAFKRLELASRGDSRWFVRNVALGSSDSVVDLNILNDDKCSSILTPFHRDRWELIYGWDFAPSLGLDHVESVPVRRLDGLFDEIAALAGANPRCFLKLDTQGFDIEVFRGAAGCLDQVVALQSELSVQPLYEGMPGMWDALAVFREAGFMESALFPVGMDERLAAIEFDCVMVRL